MTLVEYRNDGITYIHLSGPLLKDCMGTNLSFTIYCWVSLGKFLNLPCLSFLIWKKGMTLLHRLL